MRTYTHQQKRKCEHVIWLFVITEINNPNRQGQFY